MRRTTQYILLCFLLAIFAVFLVWPIVHVVSVAFVGVQGGSFTFGYIAAILQDGELRRGLLNCAMIAVGVTLACTLISVPLALMSVRLDFFGKSIVNSLMLVPLILPPFVGAIGMRQILGRFGVLTSIAQSLGLVAKDAPVDWFGSARIVGIILVEALSLYP